MTGDLPLSRESARSKPADMDSSTTSVIGATAAQEANLLDLGIAEILRLMKEDLVMDIVLVTTHAGDHVVVSHATVLPGEDSIVGMSHPQEESICQRVLQGRLPAVMPDVAALAQTRDIPQTPIVPGAFMAAPVVLSCGRLYGVLCCLKFTASPDLDERHYQRLKMSAQHIARLVDEAGDR